MALSRVLRLLVALLIGSMLPSAVAASGEAASGVRYEVAVKIDYECGDPRGCSLPGGVAVDSAHQRAYVATHFGVTIYDTTTYKRVGGFGPGYVGSFVDVRLVAVDSVHGVVYAVDIGSGGLLVYDIALQKVVKTIFIAGNLNAVNVDPSSRMVYLADSSNDAVTLVDGTTNSVVDTLAIDCAAGVATHQASHTAYVTRSCDNAVSVIDGDSAEVVDSINVGAKPAGVIVDQSTDTVYVANADAATVTAIDAQSRDVLHTIAVGTTPSGMAVDPSTDTLYVANFGSSTVTMIDTVTRAAIDTVASPHPNQIAVDTVTHAAVVTQTSIPMASVSFIEEYAAPAITGVVPSSGPTDGGTKVVITGSGFYGATHVYFGLSTPAVSFKVDSDTQITAYSPASAKAVTRDIRVRDTLAYSPVVPADRFRYTFSPPAVEGITPVSGPMTGGTPVVITGTGFSSATSVVFGLDSPAPYFTIESDTQITAYAPQSTKAATRDVRVRNPGGYSPVTEADRFRYIASPAAISEISPSSGPMAGGTKVVITGSGFLGTSQVYFGLSAPAASFVVNSDTQITAYSPPSATVVTRDIRVRNPAGYSPQVAADRFSYTLSRPAVAGITPTSGPLAGGTEVLIFGSGFTGTTQVYFGLSSPATSFVIDSDTQITAYSPPSANPVTRDVRVRNPAGTSPIVTRDQFAWE